MFDIGLPELLVLGMLALIVFGPERLPQMASQLAGLINSLRRQAASATSELKDAAELQQLTSLANEFRGMTPRNLMSVPSAAPRLRAVFDPDAL